MSVVDPFWENLKMLASLGAGTVVGVYGLHLAYKIQTQLIQLLTVRLMAIETKLDNHITEHQP